MKKKILIVEDLLEIAQNIQKYLENSGFEVIGIISFGEDAVDFVEISRPDLILMDIDLAGKMDGVQAAEVIHENHGIPIIFITAIDSEIIVEKASSADPFGYILKPFSERELRVSIEMAFYKERMVRERQIFTQKIELLHETALAMNKCDSREKIYDFIMDSAVSILSFDCFALYLHDGIELRLRRSAHDNRSCDRFRDECLELAERTWQKKQVIFYDQNSDLGSSGLFSVYRSIISAPISRDGVIQVYARNTGAYTQNDMRLLLLLINHMVESLNRVRLQKELQDQAIHDPLTGTYNRFYLYKYLEELSRTNDHPGKSLAFLMVDVNEMKAVNDQFGHQTGDNVLKSIALILTSGLDKEDIIIRYGGDEFLIILPNIGREIQSKRQEIMEKLDYWNRYENPYSFPIHFAVGIAFSDDLENCNYNDLLSAADRDMYKNKNVQKQGKDR